jgi:hypothetical protein
MRTMSKEGTAAPATAGAAAGRSGGRGLPAASAGGAAGRGSAADGGAGSAADRRGADNSPGTEAARSRLGAGASGLVWGPGVAGGRRSADSSGTPWRVGALRPENAEPQHRGPEREKAQGRDRAPPSSSARHGAAFPHSGLRAHLSHFTSAALPR